MPIANRVSFNTSSAKLSNAGIPDCIDDAIGILIHMMETNELIEDEGAELVLLLIEGC
ncbi:hypothetical protein ACJOV8_004675 [Formosa sp. 3Alg 14/1]|uniref:hypothetical protein n=1 Tax=Formosa sp. 3Alg 14/1 TaxID=3382190 RepID=UPI0039BECA52